METESGATITSGQVIGDYPDCPNPARSFLWDRNSGRQDLGTLGGGWTQAHDINESGQVVGVSWDGDSLCRAFLWQSGSGMQDLGTLGGDWGTASAINDKGQVVGASNQIAGYNPHAFLWQSGTGMRDLGSWAPSPTSQAGAQA